MKERVLFVDDDPGLLRGIRRLMFDMDGEWDMEFVDNGQKALDALSAGSFDMIITDVRMPGMDGTELLRRVSDEFPSMIRIILSGYCNEAMSMKSVSAAHQFLAKPIDGDALKATLSRAVILKKMLRNPIIKKLVTDLKSLPSLPTVYLELTRELMSPNYTLQKLGEIIARDVGMTAKILQVVNSAFFGLPVHVKDPVHAVVLLGSALLSSLVLSIEIFSKGEQIRSSALSVEKLTEHCMAVGSLAKKIAAREGQPIRVVDNTMIAGMLHDVGKLIIAQNLPDLYEEADHYATENRVSFYEAEQAVIGCTHADVGAYLLGLWGLDQSIIEAVAYHHTPLRCTHKSFRPLTAVHIANALTCLADGGQNDSAPDTLNTAYLTALGLTAKVAEWQQI